MNNAIPYQQLPGKKEREGALNKDQFILPE